MDINLFESKLKYIPIHGWKPLCDYIYHGRKPGDFLTAVLSNNLRKAFEHADEVNEHKIKEYISILYTYAPQICWGSTTQFDEWIKQGGLCGLYGMTIEKLRELMATQDSEVGSG